MSSSLTRPSLTKQVPRRPPSLFLVVERLPKLIGSDQTVFDENFAESRRHECPRVVLEPTR